MRPCRPPEACGRRRGRARRGSPGREREPGAKHHQNRQAYAKRQPQASWEPHRLTCGQACRHFTERVVDVYVCGGPCGRACAMRSHGFLLPCSALELVASRWPGHSMLCTPRARGHSFSDSHRLRRAWQKAALTARAHSRGTMPCSAAYLQTAEPVGAVPRLGKRPETLIVLLTSLHYQSWLLSS